jgi:hypothetical protein
MVLIHRSSVSKHFYPKQTLCIYFISSNPFLLLSLMSVSVNIFLLLYYQDDLEYHCILMSQGVFVGYDQTIAYSIRPAYLELMLSQVCLIYHHFLFDISLCGRISNATSTLYYTFFISKVIWPFTGPASYQIKWVWIKFLFSINYHVWYV